MDVHTAMTGIVTLKREAAAASRRRDHRLGRWSTPPRARAEDRAYAECRNAGCRASVSVDTRPPPNGIDICGSAVAVNCPDTEDWPGRREAAGV